MGVDLDAVLIHEAGHAVVANALGHAATGIRVAVMDDEWAGEALITADSSKPMECAIIQFAGIVAEAKYTAKIPDDWDGDRVSAAELLDGNKDFLAQAEADADEFVSKNWATIERVHDENPRMGSSERADKSSAAYVVQRSTFSRFVDEQLI